MSITARIGKTNDDPRCLTKIFTESVDRTCDIHEPCSVISPELTLYYDSENDYINANYLYIPEWNRYYFIKSKTVTSGQRVRIVCYIDVLMSFSDEIKQLECIVTRQSWDLGNHYLKDGEIAIPQNTITRNLLFNGCNPTAYGNEWNNYDTFCVTTIA